MNQLEKTEQANNYRKGTSFLLLFLANFYGPHSEVLQLVADEFGGKKAELKGIVSKFRKR